MPSIPPFPSRSSEVDDIELGKTLQPKFGSEGLIPCIVSDHLTNEVLMFAFMNPESLAATLRTKKATFWSRSRSKLWVKGEVSGHFLLVKEIFTDCDQDVLLVKVENLGGAACHNGYPSCFYRRLAAGANADDVSSLKLETVARQVFDPKAVYK